VYSCFFKGMKEPCTECQLQKEALANALARIERLEAQLAGKKVPKNSGNSGVSPSQDGNRRHYPKRPVSGKPAGGVLGHQGHSHPISDTPDAIIQCALPQRCKHCGASDWELLSEVLPTVQVVDIPPIKPHVTQYQRQAVRCCGCNKRTVSKLPKGVYGPVTMGKTVQTLAVYLKSMHALSDQRVAGLLNDCFGLSVSQGWVETAISRVAQELTPTYNTLINSIKASPVDGSDETGMRIGGRRAFVWIFQTPRFVYFKTIFSRAFAVVESTLGATFNGTHVSDRYAGQLKLEANYKQFCLAHIIRDCRYLEQTVACAFATQLHRVLSQCIALRNEAGEQYLPHADTVRYASRLLAQCFVTPPPPDNPAFQKSRALFNSLNHKQDCLLHFLHDPLVPPTNNDSERPLRHIALLRKVFGGFRSLAGANRYDVILSVIQSAKRQGLNVLHVLQGSTSLAFN
jgi:transposase